MFPAFNMTKLIFEFQSSRWWPHSKTQPQGSWDWVVVCKMIYFNYDSTTIADEEDEDEKELWLSDDWFHVDFFTRTRNGQEAKQTILLSARETSLFI